MKQLILTLFSLCTFCSYSQIKDTLITSAADTASTATFIVKFDKKSETKDGYYLNGYVVNIDAKKAKRLIDKTIKVTGKVTIVKGLKNQPKQCDENGIEIVIQRREGDTRYILSPEIEIIE